MPWSFIIPTAASLISGGMQSKATRDAASMQADAAREATELQRQMYEEGVQRQQPFLEAGTGFFNQLAALQKGGPDAAQNFLQMDPGYGFRLGEGLKALERSAAARGGLMSGATGKALQRYGQDVASQEFGAAYNRLAGLADVGPRAAGVMTGLGQTYATNVGNLGVGAAQAAGQAALARGSAYGRTAGDIGYLSGRYFSPQSSNALQASFSQTGLGGSGFGTGLAYGNEDIGKYL